MVGDRNYDVPKNGVGTPLPNQVQATYDQGSLIDFDVVITAHHKGHFTYKACPINPGEVASQDCFDQYPLTFVKDNLYGAVPDPNYPDRAYLPPSTFPGSQTDATDSVTGLKYSHKYRLPPGLSGSNVLIQWHWVTGNSGCFHEGYDEYPWPPGFENQYSKQPCPPLSDSGSGNEQFWNCCEVEILPNNSPTTTVATSTVLGSSTTTTIHPNSTSTTTTTIANTGATVSPGGKPVGTSCDENEDCDSGSCFESICECRDDDDCLPGHLCDMISHQSSDPFLCISGYKTVGESCKLPIECASGSCFDWICECRHDADCEDGFVCDKEEPPFLCVIAKIPSSMPTLSSQPSASSSIAKSNSPSSSPSLPPSISKQPSGAPSNDPTLEPSASLSLNPSSWPSVSAKPSASPSRDPTAYPTQFRSSSPSLSSYPSSLPSSSPSSDPSRPPNGPYEATVSAYYASWQWYDRNKLATPENIDFGKIDRVNFAFFQTNQNGDLWGTDSWADPQLLFGPYDWNPPAGASSYCSWDGPTTKNCAAHRFDQGLLNLAHAGKQKFGHLSEDGPCLTHSLPWQLPKPRGKGLQRIVLP
eukprot:CCRYP_013705-RC/>CCRYP_013705-RC protein AED:0.23 eAED:0.23 QI:1063/1/1/1/0.77/0.7/10/266/585